MPGRVLMLAHHFPPTGGSGANRALAFTRYLPMFGWSPTVVTPACEFAANADAALLSEVPRTLHVVRTRSLEARPRRNAVAGAATDRRSDTPSAKSVTRSALRSQVGHLRRFPDAHVGWLPFALHAARRQDCDLLYSSSGPFTSHLVGLLAKRAMRKPWVAELRDGWYRWNRAIFPDYPAWRDVLERRLEAAVIRRADRVVLVTDRMAEAFRAQYPDCPTEHFGVVSNGFDPSQFDAPPPAEHRQGWTLVHAGALYYGRSLAALLHAARRLVDSDAAFARDFRLRLVGTLDTAACDEVRRSGLTEWIDMLGQTDHPSAIKAMRSADALLLVANTTPGAQATVPGKLFEYLAVGRPVVAIAPAASSTADVLTETGGGWLAPADDVDGIACALRRAYAERETLLNPVAVRKFDRRWLAGELAAIFDQVAACASRRL